MTERGGEGGPTRVPQEVRPSRGSSGIERRSKLQPWVLAIGGAIVALIFESIFVLSYVGALHKPEPHDVPLAIVAPEAIANPLIQQIAAQTGDAFDPRVLSGPDELRRQLEEREIYGGVEISQTGLRLVVADAAGPAAARALETFAQGLAAAQNVPLTVEHVHQLPEGDPNGLTSTYLMIAWVFGGYFSAIVIGLLRGPTFANRQRALLRIGLLALFALASGFLGSLIVGPWLDALPDDNFLTISLAGALLVFAVAMMTSALQLLLGLVGTGISLLAFVLIGNPASGGIMPREFLPTFWREVGPWLPNWAGSEIIRSIAYFDGNAIGRPILVLAVYAVVGTALLLLFAGRVRPFTLGQDEAEAELATTAAFGA